MTATAKPTKAAKRRRNLPRADLRRIGSPIAAYVGSNGSGKTLAAVRDVLLACERDPSRVILSTCPIDHPLYVPLTSWRQLIATRNAEVLLDEVTGVASARSFAALPPQLMQVFVQLRKRNVRLRWTTPNYSRADVVLREVTRTVTHCSGFLGKTGPGGWPEHRFFRWSTYDAQDYDEFQAQRRDDLKRLGVKFYLRRSNDEFASRYDTLAEVLTLDHIDVTGACLECGGSRPRPKCTCDRHPVQSPPTADEGAGIHP